MILQSLIIFIFGTIIGSFLNVVILRLGTGVSILGFSSPAKGRVREGSFCMSCTNQLSWYELIPILSFFIQRGHCRSCNSRISWQYPIVEILTGTVFLLIFNFQFSIFNGLSYYLLLTTIYYFIIFSLLIIISVYDFRHKIIPNKIVYLFIFLSLFSFIFRTNSLDIRDYSLLINNITSGLMIATPFALLWLISKGKLMGLGDAKLALGIGLLLGLSQGVAAILLAFWIGAIFGIILIVLSRLLSSSRMRGSSSRLSASSEIPFGPFLCLATFIVFIFQIDLWTIAGWLVF
ncbi:MAG: Prepilin peptidase [Candidatus Nomurabacteria bacterium GW2011_GWB1_37_5]|uniref:Prepilin peptidase n=1 Tax=Candidatus Nomurabacteria bacterium GW2011_GWB1_37_5 TaxID=1618742 RepID=A0A0G0H8X5_9BACT|nr:MAG: Prepilin peptidase [Candidatus Nomurabacteria bacterium GW2011_GWB1_37_5]